MKKQWIGPDIYSLEILTGKYVYNTELFIGSAEPFQPIQRKSKKSKSMKNGKKPSDQDEDIASPGEMK